jgi:SLAP domain-containing protein
MSDKQFTISYAPREEGAVSKLAEQLYYEDLNSVGNIDDDTVAFKVMYMFELGDKIEAKVFIINNSDKNINFEHLFFKIINEDGEVIASEILNLEELGELPGKHARPFSLFLSKDAIASGKSVSDKCKLVINAEKTVAKEASRINIGYIDECISLYEKRVLERYIQGMPPAIKDDIKLMPYKNSIDEEGKYYSILLLINGSDKSVKLADFNLIYKDQAGLIQAHKTISSLKEAEPNSVSIYKVILEVKDIMKESFEPEKCKLTIK